MKKRFFATLFILTLLTQAFLVPGLASDGQEESVSGAEDWYETVKQRLLSGESAAVQGEFVQPTPAPAPTPTPVPASAPGPAEVTPPPEQPAAPVESVSALTGKTYTHRTVREVCDAYNADAVKGAAAYEGTNAEFSGTVRAISESSIYVAEEDDSLDVYCYYTSDAKKQVVSRLREGIQVTVRGVIYDVDASRVYMDLDEVIKG